MALAVFAFVFFWSAPRAHCVAAHAYISPRAMGAVLWTWSACCAVSFCSPRLTLSLEKKCLSIFLFEWLCFCPAAHGSLCIYFAGKVTPCDTQKSAFLPTQHKNRALAGFPTLSFVQVSSRTSRFKSQVPKWVKCFRSL